MKHVFFRIYVYFFAKSYFLRFNRFVLTLGLRGMGIDNYENRKISGEIFFSKWISKNGFDTIIFDVGANEGDYASLFSQNKEANIFCFEPIVETFERLRERFKHNDKIHCFNLGLSNEPGKLKIYDKTETGSSHATIYKEALDGNNTIISREINLDTLDKFCQTNNIQHIDLLKIDTEGHEYAILCGAMQLIEKRAVDIIHFEFNKHNIYNGHFLHSFKKLLLNYKIYRLLPQEFLPITFEKPEFDELFIFQNIIAIRNDLKIEGIK